MSYPQKRSTRPFLWSIPRCCTYAAQTGSFEEVPLLDADRLRVSGRGYETREKPKRKRRRGRQGCLPSRCYASEPISGCEPPLTQPCGLEHPGGHRDHTGTTSATRA